MKLYDGLTISYLQYLYFVTSYEDYINVVQIYKYPLNTLQIPFTNKF